MIERTSFIKLKIMKPIVIDLKKKKGTISTILKRTPSEEITFDMIQQRLSLEEIADKRGLVISTIEGHVCKLIENGKINVISYLPFSAYEEIESILRKDLNRRLKEIIEENPQYTYFQIQLVKAELNRLNKIKCYE